MTLEYLYQTMLFKGMRFCSMFENNCEKVFGKLIKKSFPESTLNKNGFYHRRFPANFLKVFRKCRTVAL